MGKVREFIDDAARKFIEAQPLFFVASAPLASDGRINVSPKGLDSLRVLGPNTVAYLDLTGSGIETIAHLKENGRIVLMFCAFQGPPKILRLHGRGKAVERGQAEYRDLAQQFPTYEGARAIILVEVSRVSDSCGYSVPVLKYESERNHLTAWANKLGAAGLKKYRKEKNESSIDQLTGLGKANKQARIPHVRTDTIFSFIRMNRILL
ncbi:MAG TPA: pyridoxamine 5'-phosphate oxidase family protein [Candidatus Acidoferrales bacterium]|nr:pyridoxamine 5'-phosphate oxidase family protein [Candidatus Acidoferrales bacterium]